MNILYRCILIILLLLVIYYFYNKMTIQEHFEIKTNYKYIDDNNIELDDDFGDIVFDIENINLKIYKEGFTTNFLKENFETDKKFKLLPKTHTPRNIFTYWENKNGRTEPYSHIKLCFETMQKHFKNYNFVILTPETIKKYLPEMRSDLNNLMIAQKVDYYRVALLSKYGGIWIDADTIVLRNLDEVFDKLDNGYDFVGFGCTGQKCFNGYPLPSNGVMGSRQNGLLMNCCLNKLNKMLDSNNTDYEYFDLGKKVIWDCMDELVDYDYYHFPSEYDGSRDIDGYWIHSPNHLSEKSTKLLNEDKAFFIFLANYELMNDDNNKWFLNMGINEILNGKWWISALYRKSLQK